MTRVEMLGKCIGGTEDCKVFATMESDVNSKRVAVSLCLKYEDGSTTKPHIISRKDIIGKFNCLDKYLLDVKGNFGVDNINKIKETLNKMVTSVNSDDYTMGQDKATLEEIKERIYHFILDNEAERNNVFMKDSYGCMETKVLDEFLKQNNDLKYNRVEILRWLKIRGFLEISNNRPYDYLESVKGKKMRVYKIDLSDEIEIFGETVEESTVVEENTVSEMKEESEVTEDGNQTV